MDQATNSVPSTVNAANKIASYLEFLQESHRHLREGLISKDSVDVRRIRSAVEEHYVDDQGRPAMYQSIESTLYDDARAILTLMRHFEIYSPDELRRFQQLTSVELEGLTGDRHPRKVFDRSPFGVAALIVGTITIWMTFLRTYTGEDLSELLELIRFNSIAGMIWIVGLFVVLWFILKTVRNNRQVAFLASVARALDLYLMEAGCESQETGRG